MSKKKTATYCVVVDASVAKPAGSLESTHPTGVRCRDFLIALRAVCHRIAWSAAIKLEWDKHESRFAQQWRLSMLNLGKLRFVESGATSEIREHVQEHCSDADKDEVLKDCHLVEAALATDGRIASLDEKARGHFRNLAATVKSLQSILWVNPAADDDAVDWLKNGAPAQNKRRLKKK